MSAVAIEIHGDGEPLVLVHGLATTRVIWRRVLPGLSEGRRVVTLDVPGFGASPPAGPGFDLRTVAATIGEALGRAGVAAPFDLVGHSMGGALAIALAARDPGAVRRLVLVAPAGLRAMPAGPARLAGVAAARAIHLRRGALPLAELAWGRRLLMSPGTAEPAALPPAEVRAMLEASRGATRIAAALAGAASTDLRPALAGLTVPVGVVWGERDRIVPPAGIATITALRPGAPVARVAGAGHIPMMERPAAFAGALADVLAALSPAGNTVPGARS